MNITQLPSGIYQAELRIPKDVQHILGKKRFAKSLKTRDKRTAQQEAGPLLAEWDRQIRLARQQPDAILEELAVAKARLNIERADPKIKPDQWGYLPTEAAIEGMGLDDPDWLRSLPPSQADKYADVLWGDGIPLPHFMAQFLEAHYDKHKTRTEGKRYILEATLYVPTLELINQENARAWIRAESKKPSAERRAAKTMQKAAGYLSEYVGWLQDQRLLSDSVGNPFKNLRYPKALKQKESYVPLSIDELMILRSAAAAGGDDELVAYIDIARLTGMRLAEVGALSYRSVETVDGIECFRVKLDAKTAKSAGRLVPIASSLQSLIDLKSFDLGRRDNAVGKRFGRLKKATLPDGYKRSKCFHSIRKFVATTLEQAGVAEGVAADLVGHEKQTLTYGVYSGGSALKQLALAVHELEQVQKIQSEFNNVVDIRRG